LTGLVVFLTGVAVAADAGIVAANNSGSINASFRTTAPCLSAPHAPQAAAVVWP
jgi:hypothetical protein